MSAADTGGPAFPLPFGLTEQMISAIEQSGLSPDKKEEAAEKLGERALGMTMRDYFAGRAMSAYLTHPEFLPVSMGDAVARAAYALADAMLEARAK